MYINELKFIYNKAHATKLKINGNNVKFTVDRGSSINIIDETTFEHLQNINLQKTHVRAYLFNSSEPVQMTGKFDTLESRKRLTVATIYVTGQDGGCLFNNTTAQELGLISLHLNQVDTQTKASRKKKETGLNTKTRRLETLYINTVKYFKVLENWTIDKSNWLLTEVWGLSVSLNASVKSPSIWELKLIQS